MKKILFILVCVLSFNVISQLEKGNMNVSGTLGLSANGNKLESVSIAPSFGYLLSDKWAIGGVFGVSYQSYFYSGTRWNINAGVFGRRYLLIADRFYFCVIGSLSYLRGTYSPSFPSGMPTQGNGAALTFQPNFTFFPSPHWALEANIGSIGYSFFRNSGGSNAHNFNLNYGSIELGVSYYFGKGFRN